MSHRMVEEPANLCEVRFGPSASSGIPVVVRHETPQTRLLRAAEARSEAAFVMFDRHTLSPTTKREACDLLREARKLLRRVPCELAPVHWQCGQMRQVDTCLCDPGLASNDQLGQPTFVLRRDGGIVQYLQMTCEDTRLCDSIPEANDYGITSPIRLEQRRITGVECGKCVSQMFRNPKKSKKRLPGFITGMRPPRPQMCLVAIL